jgi:hypothetical protein
MELVLTQPPFMAAAYGATMADPYQVRTSWFRRDFGSTRSAAGTAILIIALPLPIPPYGILSENEETTSRWPSGSSMATNDLRQRQYCLVVIVSTRMRYGGLPNLSAWGVLTTPHGLGYAKFVVVVDEDIDPFNLNQVWAMSVRANPAGSREAPGSAGHSAPAAADRLIGWLHPILALTWGTSARSSWSPIRLHTRRADDTSASTNTS